jgi:hypothetical protein
VGDCGSFDYIHERTRNTASLDGSRDCRPPLLLLLLLCALLSLLDERAQREGALASLFVSSPACAPGSTRYELRHVYPHVRT